MYFNLIDRLGKCRVPVHDYVTAIAIASIGKDAESLDTFLRSCECLSQQVLSSIIDLFISWNWGEGVLICIKEKERRGFKDETGRFDL